MGVAEAGRCRTGTTLTTSIDTITIIITCRRAPVTTTHPPSLSFTPRTALSKQTHVTTDRPSALPFDDGADDGFRAGPRHMK